MTQLNFGRDVQGLNAYAPQSPDDKYSVTLSNGVAVPFTVPDNFPVWILSIAADPGTSVWYSNGGTADNPAGATFAATTSELNPGPRLVYANDVLSFLTTNATADVQISLWSGAS